MHFAAPQRSLDALAAAAAAIRGLLRDSEDEFLAVGRGLADLASHADQIVGAAQGALASAEDAVDADVGARVSAEVETIRDIVRQSERAAGESAQRLTALKRALSRIDAFASEFRRIVLSLRSLGLLTRMEGSREGLESSGFLTVSADVTALSDLIQDRFQTLLDRSGPLRQLLGDAIDAARRDEATGVCQLDQVERATQQLVRMNGDAHAHMSRVGDAMREIASAFGHIVVGLQSHDITRQQLEHVAEALEAIGARRDADDPDDDALDADAADVSELQRHQVEHARTSISSAVGDLTHALRELGHRVREVEGELGRVSSDGGPLLRDLETRLACALDVLRAGARRTAAIAASTDEVAAIVTDMAGFVHDIETISSQVNLIAFNAIVRSARTGEQGRAIGVLAQEIQAVAANTQAQTSAASAALKGVATEAAALQDAMRTLLAGGEARAEAVAADLRALLGRLGAIDTALAEGLAGVSAGAAALEAQVDRTARSITYHKRAERALEPIERRLAEVSAALAATLSRDERAARKARLAAELDRYTMESEREVHARALGASPSQDLYPASPSGGDLGANVELF